MAVLTAAIRAKALAEFNQKTEEQRMTTGIGESLVRISVGLEDEQDLVADFTQALEKLNY